MTPKYSLAALAALVLLGSSNPVSAAHPVKHRTKQQHTINVAFFDFTFTLANSDTTTAAREEIVHELLAVMDEAKSPETLIVVTKLLERIKADPKVVVPAILRNADRLEVFKGILVADSDREELGACLAEAVLSMIEGKHHLTSLRHHHYAAPPAAAYTAPTATPVTPLPGPISDRARGIPNIPASPY